jgi:hypothetical protein
MKVLVTGLCRPRDGVMVFFPGKVYDLDPALAHRITDTGNGQELDKSSLEAANKGDLYSILGALGVEYETTENKSALIDKILGGAPEAQEANPLPRQSRPDARSAEAQGTPSETTSPA